MVRSSVNGEMEKKLEGSGSELKAVLHRHLLQKATKNLKITNEPAKVRTKHFSSNPQRYRYKMAFGRPVWSV
jgi:hypothetical protein